MGNLIIDDDLKLSYSGPEVLSDCVAIDKDGKIKVFEFIEIKVLDKETIMLDNSTYNIEDLVIKTQNQVGREYMESESVYIKSVEDCLPEVTEFHPPLYKASINAMKKTLPLPITQTQHNRKLSAIRDLVKIGEGKKHSMSLNKLIELLSYYGLSFEDLLNKDYL